MTNVTIAIIILLIILIIHQTYITYLEYAINIDNTDECTKRQFISLFNQLGIPDVKGPNGSAIWLEESLYKHNLLQVVANSNGTIFVWMNIDLFAGIDRNYVHISREKEIQRIKDIISFSDDVYYDDFKKQVISKHYFLDGAKSLAVLAMKISTGEFTKKHIVENGLVEKSIMKLIPYMDDYDPNFKHEINEYINTYNAII